MDEQTARYARRVSLQTALRADGGMGPKRQNKSAIWRNQTVQTSAVF